MSEKEQRCPSSVSFQSSSWTKAASPTPSPLLVVLASPSGRSLRVSPQEVLDWAENPLAYLLPPCLGREPLPTLHSQPQASRTTSSIPKAGPTKLWKRHWRRQAGLGLMAPVVRWAAGGAAVHSLEPT